MAKLKATPKSYAAALRVLGGKQSIRLGNNTYLEHITHDYTRTGDFIDAPVIGVRLHQTYIVRFYASGQVTLHTGGWQTVTTKDRLNEFITSHIYQKNHNWYVVGPDASGAYDWDNPQDFTEGFTLQATIPDESASNGTR